MFNCKNRGKTNSVKIKLWLPVGRARCFLSSFLSAAAFLDFVREPQAVQDALLFSSQFRFRNLAQEFLDKYSLIFQENILIIAYMWHILQGPRLEMEA